MTDFIHEHPQQEPAPPPPREEPPVDGETGQKRVYGYIFILFVVAFALLVWAFFMNQRSTDQVLSELRGNADALQTTLTRNVELERRIDALEDELETAQETVERQKLDASRQTQALMAEQQRADATGLLWQLEYRWASGDYDACRALVAQLKPLAHALRTESGEGVPSELARFQALAAAPELDAGQDAPQTP